MWFIVVINLCARPQIVAGMLMCAKCKVQSMKTDCKALYPVLTTEPTVASGGGP